MKAQPVSGRSVDAPIIRLLDLQEVESCWGVSHYRIYKAVNAGQLRRYGRPSRQAYYSLDDVVAVFGPPTIDPDDPDQTSHFEISGRESWFAASAA